ncbi:MAG TPA: hypothetical protein VEL31_17930, partial [Ktedonobacteraceae bacterium]|nr:hypothetical protein [Ktedonobacteraceae bacterium]
HHDDVVPGGERRPVIPGIGRRAEREGSAVNPDHDWPPLVVSARRPDIEVQAVLAHRAQLYGSICSYHALRGLLYLRRHGAKLCRIEHARPWRRRLRRPKTPLAGGRLRERNAFPDADRTLLAALYFPITCLNDQIAHLFAPAAFLFLWC